MENFIINLPQYIEIALAVVGAAAAIASLTPNPKDDGIIKKINSVLNIVALNVGKAKNKE